jgi:hypothetical protein
MKVLRTGDERLSGLPDFGCQPCCAGEELGAIIAAFVRKA